ncbi:MAG: hypothetical protein AB7K41_16200 [Bdellovibrionales bacterium]
MKKQVNQQKAFIIIFVGLFSVSLLTSMNSDSWTGVTAKVLPTHTAMFGLSGIVRGSCPSPCMPPGGPPLSGVTIAFTRVSGLGALPSMVQTGVDGKWSQIGFEDGTIYRVTPSGLGFQYSPDYLDVSAANDQILFTVAPSTYTVSGRITANGKGLEGVIVNFTSPTFTVTPPLSVHTDIDGYWTQTGFRYGIIPYGVGPSKPGYIFTPCVNTFYQPSSELNFEAAPPSLVTVSSADFNYRPGFCSYPSVAQMSIVSAFGPNMAATSQAASSQPLPTELAGISVKLKDSANSEHAAPLFFVSPGQINYQIPPDAGLGIASVAVIRNGEVVNQSNVEITGFQPSLFTADATGKGLAAAVVLRVKADGSQVYEPAVSIDSSQNKFVAVPIDLGSDMEQVFLILFGTGANNLTNLQSYNVTIGGVSAQLVYAGKQSMFVGLDQFNVRLPRELIGRGEVEVKLRAIGREANPVNINIR